MDKQTKLQVLRQAWSTCEACSLSQDRTQIVFGYGNPDAQVMVIGEAPGETEDKYGLPFIGPSGMLLDQLLANVSANSNVIEALNELLSIKGNQVASEIRRNELRVKIRDWLLEEYYFCNVVMCRPPDNRDPLAKEVESCRPRLLEQIYTIDPVLIVSAGKIATEAIVGKKVAITQARGEIFDVEFQGRGIVFRYPVLAILHPSYLLRRNDFNQKGDSEGKKTYNDLLRGMNVVDEFNSRHYDIQIPLSRPKREH
jgi:uracil-DNA glycosylase family 4